MNTITFLGNCFAIAWLNGARVVLRKGKRHCWHVTRGPVAAAVLAGMSAPVLAVQS